MVRSACIAFVIGAVAAEPRSLAVRSSLERQRAAVELTAALQPLAFLIGEWNASLGPAGETGGFTFRNEVQGRVIVRTNYADYPAADGRPASRHDDLMVIGADNGVVHATYYDNEGHEIRYVVSSPAAREALFESEARPGEPRYRLRYAVADDGALTGEFEIAPPGQPNAFRRYLTWSARRSR